MTPVTTPANYRKRPVVIEAIHFDGTGESCTAVTAFFGTPYTGNHRWKSTTNHGGWIITLEGEMEFSPGDWIIRGTKGEFYPCKPDVFAEVYEPADPEAMREAASRLLTAANEAEASR